MIDRPIAIVLTLLSFVFILSIYYVLTNVRLGLRDVLPGAIFATVLLEACGTAHFWARELEAQSEAA